MVAPDRVDHVRKRWIIPPIQLGDLTRALFVRWPRVRSRTNVRMVLPL